LKELVIVIFSALLGLLRSCQKGLEVMCSKEDRWRETHEMERSVPLQKPSSATLKGKRSITDKDSFIISIIISFSALDDDNNNGRIIIELQDIKCLLFLIDYYPIPPPRGIR
jgi:hypothetical protein